MELSWPNAAEKIMAEESYIQYLSGISILNNPDSLVSQAIHGREIKPANAEAIVFSAEELILDGLKGLIRNSFHSDFHLDLEVFASRHKHAVPRMIQTREAVYAKHTKRLEKLNPALDVLRPLPLLDHTIYKYICRGSFGKIQTTRLSGGLAISRHFTNLLDNRVILRSNQTQRKTS